jgi:hypothetical protein
MTKRLTRLRRARHRWRCAPFDPARPLAGTMLENRYARGRRYRPGNWRIG